MSSLEMADRRIFTNIKEEKQVLIDEIVNYCNKEYINCSCLNCTGKNHSCAKNCKDCLDDLHYHKNCIRDDYDCERMLDYYVCRYSYKYCSEIMYALETLDLSGYPYFHILSLGCGGASDLMAFESMNFSQPISYVGIDKNPCWEKIHKEIEHHSTAGKVQFFRDVDVLNNYEKYAFHGTNVLIIEYLISFFYSKAGENGVKKWFDELVRNVISQKTDESPLLVIINDADSINTGRDVFPYLRTAIENSGMTVSFESKRRFKDHQYYKGSIKYPTKTNKFNLPLFVTDSYCPAVTCESAQLILEVI